MILTGVGVGNTCFGLTFLHGRVWVTIKFDIGIHVGTFGDFNKWSSSDEGDQGRNDQSCRETHDVEVADGLAMPGGW